MINHQAIYNTHSNVKYISGDDCFDGDGNSVAINQSAVDTEVARLTNVNALADMRTKRDRLLTESDWTQSRDVTLSDDNDWKTYRQALRDLPSGKTTKAHVDAATWPTKP
jgi:hypothetical protein